MISISNLDASAYCEAFDSIFHFIVAELITRHTTQVPQNVEAY